MVSFWVAKQLNHLPTIIHEKWPIQFLKSAGGHDFGHLNMSRFKRKINWFVKVQELPTLYFSSIDIWPTEIHFKSIGLGNHKFVSYFPDVYLSNLFNTDNGLPAFISKYFHVKTIQPCLQQMFQLILGLLQNYINKVIQYAPGIKVRNWYIVNFLLIFPLH